MKIIFFGTPEFVVPILSKLSKVHEIVAVVTQPPKPVGREQFKKYSSVDDWAHKRNIPIIFEFDKTFPEANLGVCAAYGKIVPETVINKFKFGILNIHPSLLPKYRGASPINEAIKNGDTECGVTIIKMDKEMDHGGVVTFFKEEILPDDTTVSLREKLFERSGDVLIQLIPAYVLGKVKPKEQNEKDATFTKVLTKEDGFIDFTVHQSPLTVHNFIRAMNPWPGAWTKLENQKRLKLLKAHLEEEKLILDEVQLEGKDPVSWKQFKEGYPKADFL
ncbi:MAG: methionyl-tRNA formyltransferase [Candidatus Woesebacteria bacterium]|nr:methionyl-tRNA formyltransferase [Candidatus Woesebacteria bacterium]